jgi:hypothetical protein
MDIQFWVALGIIALLGLLLTIGNRKKKWYKVYTATNIGSDIMCVYRKQGDYFFGENIKDMITAHYQDGSKVFIPKHWVLKVEVIAESQVNDVICEINDLHKQQQIERDNLEAS